MRLYLITSSISDLVVIPVDTCTSPLYSSLSTLSISKWLLHAEGTLRKSHGIVIISRAEVLSHVDVAHSMPISLPYSQSSRCCSTLNSRNSRWAP